MDAGHGTIAVAGRRGLGADHMKVVAASVAASGRAQGTKSGAAVGGYPMEVGGSS